MKVYVVHRCFSSFGIWHPIKEVIVDASFIDNLAVRLQNADVMIVDLDKVPEHIAQYFPGEAQPSIPICKPSIPSVPVGELKTGGKSVGKPAQTATVVIKK